MRVSFWQALRDRITGRQADYMGHLEWEQSAGDPTAFRLGNERRFRTIRKLCWYDCSIFTPMSVFDLLLHILHLYGVSCLHIADARRCHTAGDANC